MTASEQPAPERDGQNVAGGHDGSQQPPATPTGGVPVPPPPPGQQPCQPQQPQPQQPYYGAPQPPFGYGQAPQQPYPYGQQPYGAAPQQPYGAYPQPPYPAAPVQPKKKVWPWVLTGCLLVFVLGIGGCVGCVSCAMMLDPTYNGSFDPYYDDEYDGLYDPFFDDGYDYGFTYPYGDSEYNSNGADERSYEAIKEAAGDLPNEIVDGRCSPGVYRVGAGQDIEPGRYFFEGSMDEEGYFTVFDGTSNGYEIESAITYFGNYFADLEEGDLVVFTGPDDGRMYLSDKADFKPEAPYESGLYRVGTDIPAGTYTVTAQDEAAAVSDQDSAAYVMKSINFDDDPVVDTKYVLKGGTQTVTVKDGQWLELFAATATPAE